MRMQSFVASVLCLWAAPSFAADIPTAARTLLVVDKLVASGKAKVVYRSSDGAAPITKGSGTDPTAIDAVFDFAYVNGATAGQFVVPAGGWTANDASLAQYDNPTAPIGGGVFKVKIKPNELLKLVGRSLGDTMIDIFGAGHPGPDGVKTVFTVNNDGETNRHCTLFPTCIYKLIAGGTGTKLRCQRGTATAC